MKIARWRHAMILCVLLMALLLLQMGCTSVRSVPDTKSSVDKELSEPTVLVEPDVEEKLQAVAAEHPGGISYGILGSPDQKMAESSFVFRTEVGQSFIGQFDLRSDRLVPHTYALLCMSDYRQFPCAPESSITQTRSLSPGEVWRVPLQIPIGTAGVHDLLGVFQEDPRRDGTDERGNDRTSRDLKAARVNIIAGAVDEHPPVHQQSLSERSTTGRWHSGFIVSDRENPSVSQGGGWQYWTNASAQADQELPFYLHFDNRDEQAVRYAAVAFIDFIQVPIKVREEMAQSVIFVRARPKVWQTLRATVQMPRRTGRYEFRLLGIVEPYTILNEDHPNFPAGIPLGAILWVYSSSRVRLDVR